MFKVKNLIINHFDELLDNTFESARKTKSLSVEEFASFLETDKGQETFNVLDNVVSDVFIKSLTEKSYRKIRKQQRKIEDHVVDVNLDLFRYYQAFADTTQRIYIAILESLRNETGKVDLEKRDYINLLFYGTLCRTAEEVGLLLRNGYSNAALITWRSFHEHAVIATFLMEKDAPELYQRFIDADVNERRKQLESYVKRHVDLNFPPLDETLIKETKEEFECIKNQYEKEFFNNGYNWAVGYLNEKANFNAIEAAIDFGRFRPYYILASSRVHPSYRGIVDLPADGMVNLRALIEPSDQLEDLVDPAQLILAEFLEVNDRFLHIYSADHEYETNTMILQKIYDKFRDAASENEEE
ncbi:hypothetical protein SAMN05518672_108201 [Chitinophaga sp. CF118]|uniref:DUF5677 domain-containing protein n=1 Tax=Chitinophaga sp. CF118 TaxID=1884367 RepID=UPI0008E195F2|nr:DUF5677 domain-containing protein [Chitinophaga sp. CF118]SFE63930.1 hypothetical protein SAMN05518672_108201 [Chitinophaga sp. CF118]